MESSNKVRSNCATKRISIHVKQRAILYQKNDGRKKEREERNENGILIWMTSFEHHQWGIHDYKSAMNRALLHADRHQRGREPQPRW